MGQLKGKWIEDGAITPPKVDTSSTFVFDSIQIINDSTVGGDSSVLGDLYVDGTSHMGYMQLDSLYVGSDSGFLDEQLFAVSADGLTGFFVDGEGTVDAITVVCSDILSQNIITGNFICTDGTATGSISADSAFISDSLECTTLNSGDGTFTGNVAIGSHTHSGPPNLSVSNVQAFEMSFRYNAETIDCSNFYGAFEGVETATTTTLPGLITDEETYRIAGDDYLNGALSTETSLRVNADSAEQSARIAADSAEQSARVTADSNLAKALRDMLSGLTISYTSGDTITVSSGAAAVDDNSIAVLSSSFDKSFAGTWISGDSNTGRATGATAPAINVWYYVILLYKPSNGDVDIGFDSDSNATNLLADSASLGFTKYRRIGAVCCASSSTLVGFKQIGHDFINTAYLEESFTWVSGVNPTPVTLLRTPLGVHNKVSCYLGSVGGTSDCYIQDGYTTVNTGVNTTDSGPSDAWTNLSSLIYAYTSGNNGKITVMRRFDPLINGE